jgi:hypothetical protein
MSFQLRDQIHWCVDGGRSVFLDVEGDRYFCLPAAANAAFLRLAAGISSDDDAACLQPLLSSGAVVELDAPATFRRPPSLEPVERDFRPPPGFRPSPLSVVREFLFERFADRMLRKRPFCEVVSAIRRKAAAGRVISSQEERLLGEVGAASDTISTFMRVHDRCLTRAIGAYLNCLDRGLRPKLVFGVTAHPFAAHCWLQSGTAVVVGDAEQARLYTPILVLE